MADSDALVLQAWHRPEKLSPASRRRCSSRKWEHCTPPSDGKIEAFYSVELLNAASNAAGDVFGREAALSSRLARELQETAGELRKRGFAEMRDHDLLHGFGA